MTWPRMAASPAPPVPVTGAVGLSCLALAELREAPSGPNLLRVLAGRDVVFYQMLGLRLSDNCVVLFLSLLM